MQSTEVLIVGAGIGGLTLALSLHQAGIACVVCEAAPEIRPLGVGINVLPHAVRELDELGLLEALSAVGVETRESAFFNRYGQLIYAEPAGRFAGYDWPQFSLHRGDLQAVLARAVRERLGAASLLTGRKCVRVGQDHGNHGNGVNSSSSSSSSSNNNNDHDSAAVAYFSDAGGRELDPISAGVIIGCDGLHSVLRRQFYPDEGEPRYSGINMWRGVTRFPPFLSGATMVRAGWFTPAKMVIYPIRTALAAPAGDGLQLVNWVVEIETPQHLLRRDWNRAGKLDEFLPAVADWTFDWLDVPAMLCAADAVYEFPMVDQDPLPRWTFGCVTLLGDAAHPMVPRGSNGAVQSIIDARFLAGRLKRLGVNERALQAYEATRREATTNVVLMNRSNPPDAILREVWERSGDKPYAKIEDVISRDELAAIANRYRSVSGAEIGKLRTRPSYV